jgi:SOS-response transcriptional repressor LexA
MEDDSLNVHDYLVRNPAATEMIRLNGDELEASEHLVHGTIMVVDNSRDPQPGDLVHVEYEGRCIFIRLRRGMRGVVRGVVVGAARRL